jgi:hypothetical protein
MLRTVVNVCRKQREQLAENRDDESSTTSRAFNCEGI